MKFEFILSNTKRKKEMLNANDRPHWTQKAKITAYLRQIGRLKVSEGKYTICCVGFNAFPLSHIINHMFQ